MNLKNPVADMPCKDCKDRYVGCHDHCEKYLKRKAEYEKKKSEYRRKNCNIYGPYGSY